MRVRILDLVKNKTIVEYPVIVANIDKFNVTEKDYCDEAWLSAVSDGFVEFSKRDLYLLSVIP